MIFLHLRDVRKSLEKMHKEVDFLFIYFLKVNNKYKYKCWAQHLYLFLSVMVMSVVIINM